MTKNQAMQLKLVGADPCSAAAQTTPSERVFQHWVFMLHKNPRRCALGPTRRRAIDRALQLYDEDTLLLAIEGCAASPWHAGENDRDREFNGIELILRDEAHIERFAEDGERLRDRAAKVLASRHADSAVESIAPVLDAAEVQRLRENLRAVAAGMAKRVL